MAIFVGYTGDGRWENFEAEAECLADLNEAMKDGALVLIDILMTRRGADKLERYVVRRRPMLLSARHFAAIENCTIRIIEEID